MGHGFRGVSPLEAAPLLLTCGEAETSWWKDEVEESWSLHGNQKAERGERSQRGRGWGPEVVLKITVP